MNPHEPGWFAKIKINNKDFNAEGTVNEIMRQFVGLINNTESRTTGPKRIKLFMQDAPVTDEMIRLSELQEQVEATVDFSDMEVLTPEENESLDELVARLMAEQHMPKTTATNTARAMLGMPEDETFTRYKNDPLAKLAIRLNANTTAFLDAAPNEFHTAKDHVIRNYPEYAANIPWRA